MAEKVYKVCMAEEWDAAIRLGRYTGSADDQRDGFIHLSTRNQLERTLARHFSEPDGRGRSGLVLVSIDPEKLAAGLKWEPARDGTIFPHLYGPLDPRLAEGVQPLPLDATGRHLIPGDH